jgi:translation initiation factor IF-2
LEKVRVYELAKELNTTSKRLMEKLAEINVVVKNHMSLLEDHELDALYKHIGIIKHEDKKEEAEEKKAAPPVPPPKPEVKKEVKNAPRIIRTTEIIINSKNDSRDSYRSDNQKGDIRGGRNDRRNEYIRSSDSNSGLLAGFVRKSRSDYATVNPVAKPAAPVKNDKPASDMKETEKELQPTNKEADTLKKDEKTNMHEDIANTAAVGKKGKQKQEASAPHSPKSPQSEEKTRSVAPETVTESKTAETTVKQQEPAPQAVDQPQPDKSQKQAVKPQNDKPAPQSDRPQYQGDRPTRPQGDRPPYQGDRPPYQGNRPQGDRPPYQGNRPQGGAGLRSGSKPLDIPKPDISIAQKDELGSQRSESRREFISKDIDKDVRREQRKETPKILPGKASRKIKTTSIGLSEKKGVSEILSEEFILNEFYNDTEAKKKRQIKSKKGKDMPVKHIPQRAVLTSITIPETITVKDLAEALKKTSTEIIKKLMNYGMMATLNQEVDFDTATLIADEYNVKTEKAVIINEEDILFDDSEETDPEKLVPRPPVVVVMGHVDHGKTSLLDAIRSTHVIESEAGGITQHIGAYTVNINDRNITFLDTPGHEAFTAMRARGAQVTDIAILVVAADDGVMPQTVEAINHAKAANVSIIVAINKIDKPGANPDRVKQELTQHGIVSEEWGGDVICVNVSAKKRENIDQLLEMVLLTADMLELKADPNRQAKGTVIEAKLDKNRGPLATVLVQRGTLKVGDSLVTGATVGRIRAMVDDKGNMVKSAGPSKPVEILGLSEVPEAGELFYAIEDEKVARHLAEKRKIRQKEEQMHATSKVTLDDLFKQIQEGKVKDLNIIIKADVQGSVEAVKQSLEKLSNDEVRVKVIHGGVGAITESDVTLADVSNAIIIGFNVRPGANVADYAENVGVDLRLYSIIYNAIEDIEAAMKGLLEPTFKEVVLGHTEIRQIFKVSGVGSIAGCYVLDGKILRNSDIRIIRDGIVVHEGKLASLKRFKDDAKEVLQGFECGLSIERFNDIKEKDIIESYAMEEVKR